LPEVICDTSPIQYLYQIGHLELLVQLAGQVIVPPAVVRELEAGKERGVELAKSLGMVFYGHLGRSFEREAKGVDF